MGGVLAILLVVDWMPANVVQQLRHGELRQLDGSQDVVWRFSRENRSSFVVYPLLEYSCEFRQDGADRRLGCRGGKLSGRQAPGLGTIQVCNEPDEVMTWEWKGAAEMAGRAKSLGHLTVPKVPR